MTAEKSDMKATSTIAEAPQITKPEKEHEWLRQFVGEWRAEGEYQTGPGSPPVKLDGNESVRAIGEFWIVASSESANDGTPFTSIQTLGYDPQKKKFVGTWVDSMTSYMWKYEGRLDATEKILTLETEGPTPSGQPGKFKEVIESKSKDHKVFTSSIQGEDGNWATMVTINYYRKN